MGVCVVQRIKGVKCYLFWHLRMRERQVDTLETQYDEITAEEDRASASLESRKKKWKGRIGNKKKKEQKKMKEKKKTEKKQYVRAERTADLFLEDGGHATHTLAGFLTRWSPWQVFFSPGNGETAGGRLISKLGSSDSSAK